jgi:hypothetical protein
MNIVYIHQLTDESTKERNSDEIKSSYSSVPMNVMIYSSVTWNRGIYLITFTYWGGGLSADLTCGFIYSSINR